MANLTSELIVKLVDQVSGPAGKAASGLSSIEKAASKLGSRKLGEGLNRELEKIKATPRQFRQIEREYATFQSRMAALGPIKADHAFRMRNDWHTRTIAQIRGMRREYEGLGKSAASLGAIVAGSYGLRAAGRASIKAGANNMREDSRDYLGGLTTSDTLALRKGAMSMSGKYMSMDFSSAHERLRDTAQSMGSVEKALGLADTIGAGNTVLQSLKGPEKALEESRKFFKALDTLGKNVNSGEVRNLYDGYIRALGVEGADMNMGDIFTLAKRSKSGGASLSNEFLMAIAPSLMQDMGPDRVGTAIGSMVSQIVGGRATKKSKEAQAAYGLRDGNGKFNSQDLLLSNPFEYTKKVLTPALAAKGVDMSNDGAIVAAISDLFSNQSVADLFTKMITQGPQYDRKAAQYGRAPGLSAANGLAAADPYVAYEGLLAQARNLGGALAEHVMGPITAGLNGLSTLANTFATAAKSGAEAAALIVAGVGGLAAAVAGGGAALKTLLPGVFGSAAGGVAGLVGVAGAGVAGGALASVIATEIVKGNKEAFADTASNPMLGAMSGDTGFAAAILNAPAIAEQMRRDAEEAARRKADGTPNSFNFSDFAPAAEAGAAGSASGGGFREGLKSELHGAEEDVAASVGRMLNMLNFRASPSVTPNIATPTPGKQSSIADTSRKLASRIDDRRVGNFADTDYS